VTDTRASRKIPVNHPELTPDYALLDPTLPAAMPPNLTAGTGMDVLAHAVDAVLCPAANDLTDAIGLRAIQMVFKYLPRAYRDGKDREARYRMHLASCMAGMILSQAGSGISHAMGHAFGGVFHVHHGVTVGLFLPYEIQAYAYISDKYLEICDALRVRVKDDRKSLNNLIYKIRALMEEVDIPMTIKDIGVSKKEFEEKLDQLAVYAVGDPSNIIPPPYLLTVDQFKKLFRLAYTGKNLYLSSEF
jgi:alcohol dehydrogenase class IV